MDVETDGEFAIQHKYDVFIVYSEQDVHIATHICSQLKRRNLRCLADFEGDAFCPGQNVVPSILQCIKDSKVTLLILTKHSYESSWVTLETVLALEKSQKTNILSLRLILYDVKGSEVAFMKKGLLKNVPDLCVDFNKDNWEENLVRSIHSNIPMPQMYLQVGCLAHGQVFSHFVGLLRHMLPVLKTEIQKSEIYKREPRWMSTKYYIMLPGSCKIHDSLEGRDEDSGTNIVKVDQLHFETNHVGKPRVYNLTIYMVERGEERYYFIADFPNVLKAMYIMKEKELADVDIRCQIARFYYTLNEVVNHAQNEQYHDTVRILPYNENVETMQDVIFQAVSNDIGANVGANCSGDVVPPNSMVPRTPQRLLSQYGDYAYDASVYCFEDSEKDKKVASDIIEFLESHGLKVNIWHGRLFGGQDQARWSIFVISRESLQKDRVMVQACINAVHGSVSDNRLTVLPVLVDLKPSEIPRLIKWVTIVKATEPRYQEKLVQTIRGGNITVQERLPSGDVATGLAWAYIINYLPLTIYNKTRDNFDFFRRIRKFLREKDIQCGCIPKVVIIVPKSCTSHQRVEEQANVGLPSGRRPLEYLGHIEPVTCDAGGQKSRVYKLHMYRYMGPDNQSVCFLSEYCTPIETLHEMANTYPFAGLMKPDMYEQAKEFVILTNDLMERPQVKEKLRDLTPYVHLMYYDDEVDENGHQMTLLQAFEETLQKLEGTQLVYQKEHALQGDPNNPLPSLYYRYTGTQPPNRPQEMKKYQKYIIHVIISIGLHLKQVLLLGLSVFTVTFPGHRIRQFSNPPEVVLAGEPYSSAIVLRWYSNENLTVQQLW